MSDEADYEPMDRETEEERQGFTGADIVGVMAVSSFLAAIALTTFFLTTALAHN